MCRPRFFTPRDESFPTLGPQVGEVARRLGKPLMPWQQETFDVAYEYDPDTGLFRYDEVDCTVPRQSGKTTQVLAKKVHRLTVMARALGPQRSTYTAQKRNKARAKLEKDFAEVLRGSRSFREVPHSRARPQRATDWRLSLNNGSEHILFGSGSYLQIDAPSRTGGHGDTLDDGTIDEAFAHEDDTIEAGMRPSMATRRNAQLWVISTAGDARSKYLWRKVLAGRAASESGQHGRVCYVEYSAPDDADPGDPATWRACMPALGHTITEQFIQGEYERALRSDGGLDQFRRAYLNQWPEIPVLEQGQGGAIGQQVWSDLADPDARNVGARPSFGVAAAPDGSWAAVAAAWSRSDGSVQVEVVAYRPGLMWLDGFCSDLRSRWGGTVVGSSSVRGFVSGADEPGQGAQAQAHVAFEGRVSAGTVRHGNQPELNTAVRAARWKPYGDSRMFDRKGSTDISPLDAAALAVHGLTATDARPGRFVSF